MSRNNTTTAKKSTKIEKISIIIAAAGAGKKMRSIGPQALMQVKGQALIDRQLALIKEAYPKAEIIVGVGHDAVRLMNYLPDYVLKVENEKYEETGVARTIGMCLRVARGDLVCIIHGDLIFNKPALVQNISESTIVLDRIDGFLNKEEDVGCTHENGYVENLMPELKHKWAQITFLLGKELKTFKQLCWNAEKFKLFDWEIVNEIISKGGKFRAVCPTGIKAIDVDINKDLDLAEKI